MLTISARLNLITSGFKAGMQGAMSTAKQFASATQGSFASVSANATQASARMRQTASTASASISSASQKASASLKSMSGAVKTFSNNVNKALNNGFVEPAEKAKVQWKDVARIVQGIIISKVFYTGLHAISNATAAVWEFAKELEKTKIAFDNLFGDTALTDRFMSVLKDAAIDNALFDFSAMEDASKRLLAYGIDYKNLMYVMNGVMAAASVTGDATKVESISRALGQIYTKGRLVGQEVLQLTEAGVPVYDILNKKLGITEKEMANIADQGITAADAINALVDGLTEKYGAVLTASKYTMTGMINNVKDVLLMLGEQAIQPVFNFTKAVLYNMQQSLEAAYQAMKTGGLGAAFESLIPDEFHDTVRMLVAAFMNLGLHIAKVSLAIKDLAASMLPGLAYAFSTVVFVVTPILNALTNLLRMISKNTVAMRILTAVTAAAATAFLLLRVRALGLLVLKGLTALIMTVAKALSIMSAMATGAARSLLLIVGLMLALGAGIAAATGKLDGLVKRLATLSGYNSDMILQPGSGTGTGDIDEFNNKLEGTKDAYDDAADAAGRAKKANDKYKAGLLSFDEVFKLNEQSDSSAGGSGGGVADDLTDYANLGLGGLKADSLIPDIPSFSDFATDFVTSMKDSLLSKLATAGLSGLLAAKLIKALKDMDFKGISGAAATWASKFATILLKSLSGALIGLGVHSVMSIFTEKLWEALENALGLQENANEMANVGALIGSLIGGALGMVFAGPGGAIVGSAIGHMAGGLAGLFWDSVSSFINTITAPLAAIAIAIAKTFGSSFGTVFKELVVSTSANGIRATAKAVVSNIGEVFKTVGVKAIAKGGIIGLAIGFITDAIAGMLWDKLIKRFELGANAEETAAFGQTIGGLLGTVIGTLLGGPVGAIIGGAIGTFAGGLVGVFWEKITGFFSEKFTLFSTWVADTFKPFTDWWSDTASGFATWATNTATSISTWYTDTKTSLSDWWSNTTLGFSTWWSDTKESIYAWFEDTVAIFSDWDSINSDTLGNWWADTKEGFSTWWADTKEGLSTWWKETIGGFGGWVKNTYESISKWSTDTKKTYFNWAASTLESLAQWVLDQHTKFIEWREKIHDKIAGWAKDGLKAITDWFSKTLTKLGEWVIRQKEKFDSWKEQVVEVVKGFAIAALLALAEWIEDTIEDIGEWVTDFKETASTGLSELYDVFVDWITDIGKDVFDKLFGWIDKAIEKLVKFIKKAKEAIAAAAEAESSGASSSDSGGSKTRGSKTGGSKTRGSTAASSGHALGGIFNREHVARFAEGNKAEAVIPLENAQAMQPFVDAISQGILEGLLPAMAQVGGTSSNDSLPPMYVGTLVADERGLKQLYKKFELIKVQENARRGITT